MLAPRSFTINSYSSPAIDLKLTVEDRVIIGGMFSGMITKDKFPTLWAMASELEKGLRDAPILHPLQ